ncbi:MAG: DUF3443 family protein [Burkholderiales bacterium]|nr:DUF3443 family protein [Burkholderiales bacterium]
MRAILTYFSLFLTLLLAACGGGGGGGSSSSSSSTPAPVVSISLNPSSVQAGQSSVLRWSVSNATSCTASGAWSGAQAGSGSASVLQNTQGTYTYTLTCSGAGGSDTQSATLTVTPASNAPTIQMSLASSTVQVGQSTTLSWSTTNTTSCTASGDWSGVEPTSGSQQVTAAAAQTYHYTLSCSGPGGSVSSSATLTGTTQVSNAVQLIMDNGPAGGGGALNVPFVSVTVCAPGTSNCQTIDHILVDTGSVGLRLVTPGVLSANLLAQLPIATNAAGKALGECTAFADGYTWGGVRTADVKLAGEVASSITIQTIGEQPGGFTSVPADCSSQGKAENTVATLGTNGIIGIGVLQNDCSDCQFTIPSGTYYGCTASSCTGSLVPANLIVPNPVAKFASDNNGTMITLPSVPSAGSTNPTGTLIFGIGTQANNQVAGQTVYKTDTSGNFQTIYKGSSMAASFLDTGSNALFFTDSSITKCTTSTGFYCPANPLTLSATNVSSDGNTQGTVSFTIVSVDALPASITVASVGGSGGGFNGISGFDWGLPFFFGRTVFTAINGASTTVGTGPFVAY